MIISFLLRSTLLLLVVNHSVAQEWYNYGPEFYSPSMVKDTPPSFLKKREAEISANDSKLVYLPDYPSNIRQKRDLDDADNEQHDSDVTEYTSNDVLGHVDELSDSNVQSVDPNSFPDINDQRANNNSYEYANSDTSNGYEYPQSDTDSGANSDTNNDINSDINGDVNSDTNDDVNSDTNNDFNSDANGDVNSNTKSDFSSDANIATKNVTDSDANIVTSSVLNGDVNSDTNTDANNDANNDANIVTNNVTNSVASSNVNRVTHSEANFYDNEKTDRSTDRSNDVMDERDEPANYADTSDIKNALNNEVIKEGSGESSFQAGDSHTINKEENDIKLEGEHAAEADQSNQRKIVGKKQENKTTTALSSTTTTNPNESGSGSFRREEEEKEDNDADDDDDNDDDDELVKGDEDEDEDEQPVKRQNLGMKLM